MSIFVAAYFGAIYASLIQQYIVIITLVLPWNITMICWYFNIGNIIQNCTGYFANISFGILSKEKSTHVSPKQSLWTQKENINGLNLYESWRHSSEGRALAQQVQIPEFKPWYHQKKKKRICMNYFRILKFIKTGLGAVVHTCNPSFLEDRQK
jgi:hypothetical protein